MNTQDTVADALAVLEFEGGMFTASDRIAPAAGDGQADVALVRQAQAGDVKAMDSLLRRHQSHLLSHARRNCGNCGLVEDLCQETCLGLISHLSNLREPQAFPSWIETCLDNAVRHCRRKNCKKVGTPSPEDGPYLIEGVSAEVPDGVEADWEFVWNVLWAQSNGMGGRLSRVAICMLRFYDLHNEFPSVRALAEATQYGYGTAERSRRAVLCAWRRALIAAGVHPEQR